MGIPYRFIYESKIRFRHQRLRHVLPEIALSDPLLTPSLDSLPTNF